MAIVEVDSLTFSYPPAEGGGPEGFAGSGKTAGLADAPAILDKVSFEVEEGEFCVLVGKTGCGKTTLLRLLKPELMPAGQGSGTVRVCGCTVFDGAPTGAMSPLDSASHIGFVMQDPAAQIVCDSVWHELAFGLENLGMPQDVMRRRVAEVAHFFGIGPWIRQQTETLSGGQKQLVNLAAVLALRPRVLLLDEPTAQLDPHARKQFLFMLSRVNRELGVTVVMATHSPEDVEGFADRFIELGDLGPLGTREQVEARLAKRFTARLPLLDEEGPVLYARDLRFRYHREDDWVLRGVDMDVAPACVHAIVGGNGCGKSTLLKVLAGIAEPQRGTLRNRLRVSQALLPQDPKALFVCDTVAEELAEWRSRGGYSAQDEREILERFGLADAAGIHPYDLSGGQQQKLALAKILLCRPRLLLLDEPTKGLDPWSCADVSRILRKLAETGCCVVLVTHDLDFALVTADYVSMLFDGETACTETTEEFFRENLVYRPNEEARLFGLVAGGA